MLFYSVIFRDKYVIITHYVSREATTTNPVKNSGTYFPEVHYTRDTKKSLSSYLYSILGPY